MQLREVQPAEQAEFLRQRPGHPGLFLLTRQWHELEVAQGQRVDYWGWYTPHLSGLAVCVTRTMPLGASYVYVPYGPFLDNPEDVSEVMEQLRGKYPRALWIRFEPKINSQQVLHKKFIKVLDVQPRATLMLELKPEPEELLQAMHQKTRYNIRLSEKKQLEFRVCGAEA